MSAPKRVPKPPPPVQQQVKPIPERVLALGEGAVERFCEVAGQQVDNGVESGEADREAEVQVRDWLRQQTARRIRRITGWVQ